MMHIPTYADVETAARRLQGHAHRTPVLTSRIVDEASGAKVFFKCENFQRTGAFKFRGAFNALSALPETVRRRGVIAFRHRYVFEFVGWTMGLLEALDLLHRNMTMARLLRECRAPALEVADIGV